MRRWSPSFLVVVLSLLGAAPAVAQVVNPELLMLPPGVREPQALVVRGAAEAGTSHTLGWFYYDALVERGYVDPGNPDDPMDDVLIDSDGNGLPDFHEDLYNLNPSRGYIGQGPRCTPERLFTHPRASGGSVLLREPDLLTGSCSSPASYRVGAGPRRWPTGAPGYPARPGGAVVGQPMSSATDLVTPEGTLVDGAVPGQVDAYFGDRGVFPHIPNLLEPQDPLNLGMGIGQILLLSTDDDLSWCPEQSLATECLAPRMTQSEAGVPPLLGPIWDSIGADDGIPDYKASAFDSSGRLIPGNDPTAPITEADRRVAMGSVDGRREIVFFLVTYSDQGAAPSTDACFLPTPVGGGRFQCDLWGHGDINVYFSKTLLNLDLYQGAGTVVASVNAAENWLQGQSYLRLRSPEMGSVDIGDTVTMDAVSVGQKTPHVLILKPSSNVNAWVMGWEDVNSGGSAAFQNAVFLLHNVAQRPSETLLDMGVPNPATEWEPVTFRATVRDLELGDPLSSGEVEFLVDGAVNTTVLVDSTGTATTSLSFAPGEYTIAARYVPEVDGTHAMSRSEDAFQTVDPLVDGGTPDGGEDAGPEDGGEDAGEVDAGPVDSGSDAGEVDAGEPDAGEPDAGEPDAGEPDAGEPDAGEPDSGSDAGEPDAGESDAGEPDAGAPDSGSDAGEPDAGEPDAGEPDAGEPDAGSDAGGPDAGAPDAGSDAGEPDAGPADSGSDAGEVDAGSDAGEVDAGDTDAGSDAGSTDAGSGDAGSPTEDGGTGPRDLKVTGWGCGSTDAGGSSLMLLSLWLGLSLLRSRRRAHR
ncbi:Ig-like domain repeat protein [Myxococcus stipitatus]|uniref:Ig-like domain repeat protein n=1 Tax=Myxococcus stipitatus TaxID=83455 RepID=UPI003144EBB1